MTRSSFLRGSCLFGALTALALFGGCSHGTAAREGEPGMTPSQAEAPSLAQACPMNVPGTQVAERDTDNGAALEFTTTSSDQLDTLRQRVQSLADMHNKMIDQMQAQQQQGTAMTGQGGSGCLVAGVKADVEKTDNGARLVFQPSGQIQAQDLRQSVKSVASQMQSGSCPTQACMQGMGTQGGMMQPGQSGTEGGMQQGTGGSQGGTMEGSPAQGEQNPSGTEEGTENQGTQNQGSEQGTQNQGGSGY